jgi:predicted unusual protein kinase regulating ubiquinone biosynthesis (AarF/ABC1/UbiB family)
LADSIRTGRLERALSLARVGARTGATFLTSRGSEAAAAHALKVLGNLRGLAAKVGQTLSYVDGIIPEKHRKAYEVALAELQRSAPSSSFSEVKQLIEQELGRPLAELFLEFEERPFASASIGQVHRARLKSSEEVAVKIQHTGIDKAFDADLKNIGSLTEWMRWILPGGLDPSEVLDEVITRFREELDYEKEARNIQAFREFWATEPGVHIPRVFPSHSSRRVLTTQWLEGKTLVELSALDENARRASAERLWYFVFRSILVGGAFHADPHPGNYAFLPGGEIVVYDFGCVQPLPEYARVASLSIHGGAVSGDRQVFRDGLRTMLRSRPGSFETALIDYVEQCFRPISAAPFRISRDWVTGLTEAGQSSKKAMLGKDSNPTVPPPHLAMMNRLQFGFYSVLARLDVEVDYREIERRILEEAIQVPAGAIAAKMAQT